MADNLLSMTRAANLVNALSPMRYAPLLIQTARLRDERREAIYRQYSDQINTFRQLIKSAPDPLTRQLHQKNLFRLRSSAPPALRPAIDSLFSQAGFTPALQKRLALEQERGALPGLPSREQIESNPLAAAHRLFAHYDEKSYRDKIIWGSSSPVPSLLPLLTLSSGNGEGKTTLYARRTDDGRITVETPETMNFSEIEKALNIPPGALLAHGGVAEINEPQQGKDIHGPYLLHRYYDAVNHKWGTYVTRPKAGTEIPEPAARPAQAIPQGALEAKNNAQMLEDPRYQQMLDNMDAAGIMELAGQLSKTPEGKALTTMILQDMQDSRQILHNPFPWWAFWKKWNFFTDAPVKEITEKLISHRIQLADQLSRQTPGVKFIFKPQRTVVRKLKLSSFLGVPSWLPLSFELPGTDTIHPDRMGLGEWHAFRYTDIVTLKDKKGNPWQYYVYNAPGEKQVVHDPEGNVIDYEISDIERLLKTIDPAEYKKVWQINR